MYGEGISREGDLIDLAVTHNIVEKSGAWFSYKGERIGQGRENAKQFMRDNKDMLARIEAEVRKAVGLVVTQPQPEPEPASVVEKATASAAVGRGAEVPRNPGPVRK